LTAARFQRVDLRDGGPICGAVENTCPMSVHGSGPVFENAKFLKKLLKIFTEFLSCDMLFTVVPALSQIGVHSGWWAVAVVAAIGIYLVLALRKRSP
jgi:hypothetical protein